MSYEDVSKQIKDIPGSRLIGYCPEKFYKITQGQGDKHVLLSGSVHGDEPAGTHAIIDFFNNHAQPYLDDFTFTAFPCVNPYGFEHFTRGNANNVNLNREFKKESEQKEIQIILPQLKEYIFAMDLHETWPEASRTEGPEPDGEDPSEFYFWELCKDKSMRVGKDILRAVEKEGIETCKWDTIYDDNNNGGVIWYPEDCNTPCYALDSVFDSYLEKHHTNQSFTIETARGWPLEKRIKAMIISITTVLDLKK